MESEEIYKKELDDLKRKLEEKVNELNGLNLAFLKKEKELENVIKNLQSANEIAEYKHKNKRIGWFGGKDMAALNISGLVLIFLIVIGVIFTLLICYHKLECIEIRDLWGIFTPLITLIFGYMFGNKSTNNKTNDIKE